MFTTAITLLILLGIPQSRAASIVEFEVVRLAHAKELLGKYYDKSIVKIASEKASEVRQFIEQVTERALKGKFKEQYKEIAKTIIEESSRYKFDPVFLLAVIENESNFNPQAIGPHGEIGLMQIRPATARWITEKFRLPWKDKKQLRDPIINIRIGAAYLSFLREQFGSDGRLYLAAYNMGAKNVRSALDRQIKPKEYPARVMQRYVRFYSELLTSFEPSRFRPGPDRNTPRLDLCPSPKYL